MKKLKLQKLKLQVAEAINSAVREVEAGAKPIEGKEAFKILRAKYE